MAPPDLNSLPPSRSMSSSPMQSRNMTASSPPNRNDTPSPRASSLSLATAAITNAANESSRRSSVSARGSPRLGRMPSDRRRSQAALNFSLNLNDPALPSPGELSSSDPRLSFSHSYASSASPQTIGGRSAIATGDPHHQRQPSLGEIHNELEQEQEAQVNRMLQMIREQQLQLDALRSGSSQNTTDSSHPSAQPGPGGLAVLDDDQTPASERSISFPSVHPAVPQQHTRRFSSRGPSSASRSPALRPLPSQEASGDWPSSPIEGGRRGSFRDESAFYQAETAMLTRENQLLRQRIRELEKQIAEMEILPANTPATPSNLATSPPIAAQQEASVAAAVARITAEQDKT
ncbi:hypothetical protein PV08_06901 [Exophiala spinifera]|uniref:Uncharacterized protein n=1 Tax=Exophiala spinifera TaxID=91928 RepID=A0A0D2B615_9EURO|nr:uncharacterized protein PV08_06901 [Exophiala spinifera]KIW14120.1 hypothetical protein PV08_06901 [Exophiala spinifera]